MSDIAEDWVSASELGRRLGVTHGAVQRAVESGRVTCVRRDDRGHIRAIEANEALRQWAANTNPVEAARNGKYWRVPEETTQASAPSPSADAAHVPSRGDGFPAQPPPQVVPSATIAVRDDLDIAASAPSAPAASSPRAESDYLVSRAKRERHQADLAELDYLQRVGQLVDAAAVDREITEGITRVMTSILRIADRKSQILAAETDPNRVHKILTEELRQVFDECSRHFAVAAAAGVEGPAPACQ